MEGQSKAGPNKDSVLWRQIGISLPRTGADGRELRLEEVIESCIYKPFLYMLVHLEDKALPGTSNGNPSLRERKLTTYNLVDYLCSERHYQVSSFLQCWLMVYVCLCVCDVMLVKTG